MARTWPGMSRLRPSGFFDSGTSLMAMTKAITPMGTLM